LTKYASSILCLAVVLLGLLGCEQPEMDSATVARVGDATLSETDLSNLISNQSAMLDSADAAAQIVEQWVTNQLLFQEATSRGLRGDPEVQRLLADNERSVLVNALMQRLVDAEMAAGPDEAALQTYYEANLEQLALREAYVRIRHLVFDSLSVAQDAHALIQTIDADSTTTDLMTAESSIRSDVFYPQTQLFAAIPGLSRAVEDLAPGELLPVVPHDGAYHVVQLIERLDAGSVPSLEMIQDEISSRVAIQMRKQIYARQVQRLRTRALARDELEIR